MDFRAASYCTCWLGMTAPEQLLLIKPLGGMRFNGMLDSRDVDICQERIPNIRARLPGMVYSESHIGRPLRTLRYCSSRGVSCTRRNRPIKAAI